MGVEQRNFSSDDALYVGPRRGCCSALHSAEVTISSKQRSCRNADALAVGALALAVAGSKCAFA